MQYHLYVCFHFNAMSYYGAHIQWLHLQNDFLPKVKGTMQKREQNDCKMLEMKEFVVRLCKNVRYYTYKVSHMWLANIN